MELVHTDLQTNVRTSSFSWSKRLRAFPEQVALKLSRKPDNREEVLDSLFVGLIPVDSLPAVHSTEERKEAGLELWRGEAKQVALAVYEFVVDRLKVQLRDQGARHDLVDAVFALEGQDDILMIVRRVEALAAFLATDDGKNLLAGTKRAANILRIEEKKDGRAYDGAPDPSLYAQDEEKALAGAIDAARSEAGAAVAKEDFAAAMTAMAKLRPAVDAFFDKVTVNAEDKAVRENRLKLLNEIRAATRAVADFSKIQD